MYIRCRGEAFLHGKLVVTVEIGCQLSVRRRDSSRTTLVELVVVC